MPTAISPYIDQHQQRFLDELFDWLRIPSVSAASQHKADVQRAAEWLMGQLRAIQMDVVELWPTPGHPVVYASKVVDAKLPTVLVYGHYDVQPPDPLELWQSPPFEPQIRDGKIYARGSSDDKGQVYMHLKAIETLQQLGQLPCNIKFIIEGEEEVGSANLEQILKDKKDKLAADVLLISDTAIIANDTPSICVALRGLCYMEVSVTGPNRDLHSGVYGGAVHNPLNVLCEIIAQLKDAHGRISIPGFYDDVRELSTAERAEIARIPYDEAAYKKHLELNALFGEAGYSTTERASTRPTLDVNGIWGGYTGEGAKTVLPSQAHAKISMRLVANQDPEKIAQLFTQHITSLVPPSVRVQVNTHHGGLPYETSTDSLAYRAAEQAMTTTFGKKPIPAREGGSIPIMALFKQILGTPVVLMGFGLATDALHSPNEHYGVFNFLKGIETIAVFHQQFAQLNGRSV